MSTCTTKNTIQPMISVFKVEKQNPLLPYCPSFIIVQKSVYCYHQFHVPLQEMCWYFPGLHSKELPQEFLREAAEDTN